MKSNSLLILILCSLLLTLSSADAAQCGKDAKDAVCPDGLCCSSSGFCGETDNYCGDGCQSQCDVYGLSKVISEDLFDELLPHRNDPACPAKGFYTYAAFIQAANFFPDFGNTGDMETRKREVAAFLAQTSHETTGGWNGAPGGRYSWGYCFVAEIDPGFDYCDSNYPCYGKYYGRGPFQLTWNYNYQLCGEAIGADLIGQPDLLETKPVLSFESALWVWMTPKPNKPSPHDVINGKWKPSENDINAGRVPGYGLITNIINGAIECGKGTDDVRSEDRIQHYKRASDLFGIDEGENLDCKNQLPFDYGMVLGSV